MQTFSALLRLHHSAYRDLRVGLQRQNLQGSYGGAISEVVALTFFIISLIVGRDIGSHPQHGVQSHLHYPAEHNSGTATRTARVNSPESSSQIPTSYRLP